MSNERKGSKGMKSLFVRMLTALAVGLWAAPAFAICGDGELEVGEECDDGNLLDGDGCSMGCTVEDGFVWNGERWKSLSAVARAITGARWSGPRFFGL